MMILFYSTVIQLIIYFAVLAVIIAIAVYTAGLFRTESVQKELTTEEHLNNFRELNSEGKLSEEEFRMIKKQLAFQIVDKEKEKIQKTFDAMTLLSRGIGKPVNHDNYDSIFSDGTAEKAIENSDDTRVPGKGTEKTGGTVLIKK
jgi:hypothetical protein